MLVLSQRVLKPAHANEGERREGKNEKNKIAERKSRLIERLHTRPRE